MRNKVLLGIGVAVAVAGYVLSKQYKGCLKRIVNRFPDAHTKLNKIKEFNKGVK